MASRSFNLLFSGGNYSFTAFRSPGTAASASGGGAAITTKPGTGEYGNNQKDFKKQIYGAASAILSYIAANGDAPCSANLIDSGAGVFTYTIFSNPGTLASGGTAITTKPTTAELAKNAKDARKILWGAVASCISDRAAND